MSSASSSPFLFTGGRDHNIRAWDLQTMDYKKALHPPHYDHVTSFATLGTTLISGSRDKHLRRWLLASSPDGQPCLDLLHTTRDAHADWIVSMTSDNVNLFSGSKDGVIRVWQDSHLPGQSSGPLECVAELRGHQNSVNALCTLPSAKGSLLVSGGNDSTLRVWRRRELTSSASMVTFPTPSAAEQPHSVVNAWSSDRQSLRAQRLKSGRHGSSNNSAHMAELMNTLSDLALSSKQRGRAESQAPTIPETDEALQMNALTNITLRRRTSTDTPEDQDIPSDSSAAPDRMLPNLGPLTTSLPKSSSQSSFSRTLSTSSLVLSPAANQQGGDLDDHLNDVDDELGT
eukprot:GILI01024788.1.p1 GENE.GILI01024788.1~~GILI01024788.1.p1  ORF type:complete len:359 (+),score=98.63 GILI01024788.1:46-1077(+)